MLNALVLLALAPLTPESLLRGAGPEAIAAGAVTCLSHMSLIDMDATGIAADGWQGHDPKDLPERPFREWMRVYSRGDGVVIAIAQPPRPGEDPICIVVGLPSPGADQAAVRAAMIQALGGPPVYEREGVSFWANESLEVLLDRDRYVAGALDITIGPRSDKKTRREQQ